MPYCHSYHRNPQDQWHKSFGGSCCISIDCEFVGCIWCYIVVVITNIQRVGGTIRFVSWSIWGAVFLSGFYIWLGRSCCISIAYGFVGCVWCYIVVVIANICSVNGTIRFMSLSIWGAVFVGGVYVCLDGNWCIIIAREFMGSVRCHIIVVITHIGRVGGVICFISQFVWDAVFIGGFHIRLGEGYRISDTCVCGMRLMLNFHRYCRW